MQHSLSPEHWVHNYGDYLFSFAYYRLNNREQAEDLVQETFLSAYKNLSQYQGAATEKTWLTSILKNKIIDWYRKYARGSKVLVEDIDFDYFFRDKDGHWTEQAAPKDKSSNALERIQNIELQTIIDQCLERLPTFWNQVCKMKLIDEENTDTICKAFDISSSNFWVIMHRAKLQLRQCIEKKGAYA